MKKRVIVLALGCTMAFGCAVGGTLAWLTDSTTEVKNTFTTSDITIELTETTTDYQMVPGHTIAKDPKVTVKADSEDCYVFVKVEEAGGVVTYTPTGKTEATTTQWSDWLTYNIVDGWTPLVDEDNDGKADNGVYYREVSTPTTDDSYDIIWYDANSNTTMDDVEKNTVGVESTVTKDMMNAIKDEKDRPTLTFTAYATQLYKTNVGDEQDKKFTPAEAWDAVNPTT